MKYLALALLLFGCSTAPTSGKFVEVNVLDCPAGRCQVIYENFNLKKELVLSYHAEISAYKTEYCVLGFDGNRHIEVANKCSDLAKELSR